jgi:hypothetical protein
MAKDNGWPDGENQDVRDTYDKLQAQNGRG